MATREQVLFRVVQVVTVVGMALPSAYVFCLGLSDLSGYFARSDALELIFDLAMLSSVPWEILATILAVFCWRDLPQRFWITYCVNGFLAYISLPIYLHHFGYFLY